MQAATGSMRRRFRCSWRAVEPRQLPHEQVRSWRCAAAGGGPAAARHSHSRASAADRSCTQMLTSKATCSDGRAVFIPLLFFHWCARRLLMQSAHRTMLPIVRGCLAGWVRVQNNDKNKTEHIVLGVAEARFGEGGRKKTIHYSVENCDGSCFFSLFPHAFFHLSCDAKFLTSPHRTDAAYN